MRIAIAFAQIYGVFAQLPVSPVAYVPAESLSAGYRVIAELSRGWEGPLVPFVQEAPWELRREVAYPAGAVLYIEGVQGEVAVWQDSRLLFLGRAPWVWVPLLGAGRAQLRLQGERGGIGGGIYLLSRRDTMAWPAEPWPERLLPSCKEAALSVSEVGVLSAETLRAAATSGACVAVPFLPPARVRVSLPRDTCFCQGLPALPPTPVKPLSPLLFVLILGLIGGSGGIFPALRQIRWQGFFSSLPVNFLEVAVGLVVALTVSWSVLGTASPSLWALFWVCVAGEALFFALQGLSVHWAWQSWEVLWLVGLAARLMYPDTFWQVAAGAWFLRAARITFRVPSFAYLCLAEYFVYLLLAPA